MKCIKQKCRAQEEDDDCEYGCLLDNSICGISILIEETYEELTELISIEKEVEKIEESNNENLQKRRYNRIWQI